MRLLCSAGASSPFSPSDYFCIVNRLFSVLSYQLCPLNAGKNLQLQRDILNIRLPYMQHLSPYLVLSSSHWPKYPGWRSTVRCCQHLEGWVLLTSKALGVFSLATPFPAIQLQRTDSQSYKANGPTSLQAFPASSPAFFKRPTTAPSCERTPTPHISLLQLLSALVLTAFYSYFRLQNLQHRQLHKHWWQQAERLSHFCLCLKGISKCICGRLVPPWPTQTHICVWHILFLLYLQCLFACCKRKFAGSGRR